MKNNYMRSKSFSYQSVKIWHAYCNNILFSTCIQCKRPTEIKCIGSKVPHAQLLYFLPVCLAHVACRRGLSLHTLSCCWTWGGCSNHPARWAQSGHRHSDPQNAPAESPVSWNKYKSLINWEKYWDSHSLPFQFNMIIAPRSWCASIAEDQKNIKYSWLNSDNSFWLILEISL